MVDGWAISSQMPMVKFNYDQLHTGIDKALGEIENLITTTKTRMTFVALWTLFRYKSVKSSPEMKHNVPTTTSTNNGT